MPVLSVKKLQTWEDEGLHEELTRLDDADAYARDIVIAGAFPDRMEPWVRIYEAVEQLSNIKGKDLEDAADACDREYLIWQGYQSAYYLGIAVGLRLAALRTPMPQPSKTEN
jgi:hypothetical protein